MSAARALTATTRAPLPGGALLLHEPSHAVPLVSIVVALRTGSALDPAGKDGLARIAMRMLRRGCEGMTAEQVDVRIDVLGGEMAVDTSASTVALHAQVLSRNLDAFAGLLALLLGTPSFPEDELARIKRETIAEIIEARDSDRAVAQRAFNRAIFEGHPYGRSAGGTTRTVAALTRDDVLAFHRRFGVQGNVVIGLAGDVTAGHATAVAGRLVGALPPGPATIDEVSEPCMRVGRRLLVVDKPDRTQTQILVGTLGTAPHDPDHVPLVVANAVFGGTFTSRLMREVRSKRGWSYGASARTGIDRRRQAWLMWTFPAAADAAACLKLTIELMDDWVTGGITARELAFIQRYLIRSHAFEIDTAPKRLHQALDVELLSLPADYYSGWIDHVRAVTVEAASQAVTNRIRTADLLTVVVCTAAQVAEPLKASIAGLGDTQVEAFDAE